MHRAILISSWLGLAGCTASTRPQAMAQKRAEPAPSLPEGASAPAPAAPAPATAPAQATDRLENGQTSLKALAELALQAIKARDMVALNSLRVTEKEYKEIFFPEFPEAQPGNTIPVDFQWFHLNMKSVKGLQDVLDEYGGQELELMDIIVTQGVQEYKTFKAHKKVQLKVRRQSDGQEAQVRVFGSVVERNGEFKIFSFPS